MPSLGFVFGVFFRLAVEKQMEGRKIIMYIKEKLCHVINRVAEAYRKEQSRRKSKLSIRDTVQLIIGAEGDPLPKNSIGQDVMCQPPPSHSAGRRFPSMCSVIFSWDSMRGALTVRHSGDYGFWQWTVRRFLSHEIQSRIALWFIPVRLTDITNYI